MRIFLTGFMGAGKSTIGRLLARELSLPFLDLDDRIEATAGCTVRQIFEQHGETGFRRLEHEMLHRVCKGPDVVAATGGGTVTVPANRDLLHAAGCTVWLHPAFATLVERIGAEGKADRPLFRDETQALALYRARLPAYELADVTVPVERDESAEEVAARIVLLLARETRCVT
jgi:shikimate kinase